MSFQSPTSSSLLSVLQLLMLLHLLLSEGLQQDQKASSSASERSGVGSLGGSGAAGGVIAPANGSGLKQSAVQLTADICSKHVERRCGVRCLSLGAVAALVLIT